MSVLESDGMIITPADLAALVADMNVAALASEQRLNAADAELGDGDTGSMLRRIMSAMNHVDVARAGDVSAAATALAQAAMKETGSSLGTLAITAIMSLAKQAKASGGALELQSIGSIVAGMRDAMAVRGKAEIGDKTVLDSLSAISRALDEGPATRETVARAAWAALDDFRDRPCRIGRARMFPERSKGADDPGMLAVALLLDNKETVK